MAVNTFRTSTIWSIYWFICWSCGSFTNTICFWTRQVSWKKKTTFLFHFWLLDIWCW